MTDQYSIARTLIDGKVKLFEEMNFDSFEKADRAASALNVILADTKREIERVPLDKWIEWRNETEWYVVECDIKNFCYTPVRKEQRNDQEGR